MEPTQESANKFTIPFAIIIAGALIAGAIYFGASPAPYVNGPIGNEPAEIKIAEVTASDHLRGSLDAPIIIVEHSDTECPFCKRFHNTMKEAFAKYNGRVAWVYRHFPIPQLHARAMKEAEATECATEQGGNIVFWQYLDKIFDTTNSNDSLDPAELPKFASALSLNVEAFNTCLSSGRYTAAIQKSAEEAVKAGGSGTPFSVLILKQSLSANQVSAIENIVATNRLTDPSSGRPLINVSKDKKRISMSGAMPLNILENIFNSIIK